MDRNKIILMKGGPSKVQGVQTISWGGGTFIMHLIVGAILKTTD